jgi:hypothetical protein
MLRPTHVALQIWVQRSKRLDLKWCRWMDSRRLLDGCRKQGTNRVLYQGKGGMSSSKNLMGEMTIGVERLEVSMRKVLVSLYSALSPVCIRTLVMTIPVCIFKDFDVRDRMIPHILELEVFCGV